MTDQADAASNLVDTIVAFAARPDHRGARVVCVSDPRDAWTPAVASRVTHHLGDLGWLTVPARRLRQSNTSLLAHRHVALIVREDGDVGSACAWIRRSSRTSARDAIVIDARARPGPRSDAPSEAFSEYEARAGAALTRGDLTLAEALLNGAHAEADLQRWILPSAVGHRLAEVLCWRGRFDEARALLVRVPPCAVTRAWLAALHWATGDLDSARREALDLGDTAAPACVAPWLVRLLAVTDPSLRRDGARCRHGCITRGTTSTAGSPAWFDRLVTAESFNSAGRIDDALVSLGTCQSWDDAPALVRLTAEWLRARMQGGVRAVFARVEQANARGIYRWGRGRQGMHLIQAVPALLQLLHDAEDELAALLAMSRWARKEAGAEAVAFACGDDFGLVASDGPIAEGLGPQHLRQLLADPTSSSHELLGAAFVTAPIRYLSARIGVVIARGSVARIQTLQEAVETMAAVSGPAVQTRWSMLVAARDAAHAAPEIIGRSPAIVRLRETIARAAATPFAVLIEGESGTGKELVARAVHRLSARRDRPWCAVNCAALTDELIEAELFGHARGAFTGAIGARTGLFEEANLGTLFLDEVGELTSRAQAKLLRALQEREIRRLGENVPRRVDVRVIAATNQPLSAAVTRGMFREDLLFRLAVVRIRLAPLRERLEDVAVLAHAFWRAVMRDTAKRAVIGADALSALCRHEWPGNVRELQNVMAALAVVAPSRGRVTARHVAQVFEETGHQSPRAIRPLGELKRDMERSAVTAALARHAGRRTAAARELGLTRQGLAKAARRLGLPARSEVGVA